jgi:heme exporter protein D
MHWNSLDEFFAMGGYAFFVWSSVGVTVLALGIELWSLQTQRKQLKRPLSTHSQTDGHV